MFDSMNLIVARALSGVTTLLSGDVGTVIVSILAVWFLVLLIGLIYGIVQAVKKFRAGAWKKNS